MDLQKKLNKIDQLNEEINVQFPGQEWNIDFIEKVKIDFTYSSNKIEGNIISYGQTIQLLKEFVTPQNASIGDCLDIVNHKNVLDLVFDEYNAHEITESNIKRIHKELMKNPDQWIDGIHYDPGKYKIFENFTYRLSGKQHTYTAPEDVHAKMAELMNDTNERLSNLEKNSKEHLLAIVNDFHYRFLNQIHPFGDGNGRIARIFMNIILLKKGFPPVFIRDVNKDEYMNCFVLEEQQPGSMLSFMADRLLESLKVKLAFLKQK